MENNKFSLTSFNCKAQEFLAKPRKDLENENETVKSAMADELQKMGLTAKAISRLLNITDHRR
jgi:hypothetical protein